MRIDRLTVENVRMQGPERRDWYRKHSPQHLPAISGLVDRALDCCRPAKSKRAVVLGAGACTELPLERLARVCDSVVLVDIDEAGLQRGCEALPSTLAERVKIVGGDISGGVSAALARELQNQPWDDLVNLAGPKGAAPLDAAASSLERCVVSNPPVIPELEVGEGFTLVVSSLVLTQLISLPLLDVLDTLALHAPSVADLREAHPRYSLAAKHFRRRLALGHMALLGNLLAPGGMGVFVSDITGYLFWPLSGSHRSSANGMREALPVLPPEVLEIPGDFTARFSVPEPPQRWQWLASTPNSTHPGRLYDACGLIFGHL